MSDVARSYPGCPETGDELRAALRFEEATHASRLFINENERPIAVHVESLEHRRRADAALSVQVTLQSPASQIISRMTILEAQMLHEALGEHLEKRDMIAARDAAAMGAG